MVGPTNVQPRFFRSFERAIASGEVEAADRLRAALHEVEAPDEMDDLDEPEVDAA